jgi:hypothetical protein
MLSEHAAALGSAEAAEIAMRYFFSLQILKLDAVVL